MSRNVLFGTGAVVIAVLLILGVVWSGNRIDPERPTAAQPTPTADPARPAAPASPETSPVR